MNVVLSILGIVLMTAMLVPLGTLLWWNRKYRHLQNGFGIVRDTIQHLVSSMFYLVLYLILHGLAVLFGLEHPHTLSQFISLALFGYVVLRIWTTLFTFRRVRNGELEKKK